MPSLKPQAARPRRRWLLAAIGALAAASTALLTPTAAVAATCSVATVWTSSPIIGTPNNAVIEYSTSGTLLRSITVPGTGALTDIAISSDGTRMWGITFGTELIEIDMATGAVVSSTTVTGPWPGDSNSLSALPNGRLVTASGSQLYEIDPATNTSQEITGATLPAGYQTSGDFLTLDANRLLIAVTSPGGPGLFIMDLSTTPATGADHGTTPVTFGAAAAGGVVFLAGPDGNLYRVSTVPATPTTDPVTTEIVAFIGDSGIAGIGEYWGAASPEDAGIPCVPALPATGSELPLAPLALALLLGAAGAVLLLRRPTAGISAD